MGVWPLRATGVKAASARKVKVIQQFLIDDQILAQGKYIFHSVVCHGMPESKKNVVVKVERIHEFSLPWNRLPEKVYAE
jgi:hypothetical protein